MNTIIIPKKLIAKNEEPVVILPLKKWKEIEMKLEDAEMYGSNYFVKEISKRRIEKKSISLKELLKKHNI